jgi:hypothetical protein
LLQTFRGRPRARLEWCQEQLFLSLVAVFGGRDVKKLPGSFSGTMRVEDKGQSDTSTEANQTTR